MEIFKSHTKVYNILDKGKSFFILSIIAFLAAIGLVLTKGLTLGIDFSGGTVVQVQYEGTPPIDDIRKKLSEIISNPQKTKERSGNCKTQ